MTGINHHKPSHKWNGNRERPPCMILPFNHYKKKKKVLMGQDFSGNLIGTIVKIKSFLVVPRGL